MALVNVLTVDDVTGLPKLIQAGDAISPASGGTGIANNVASTLTISGNFATTLTITGITSVTLPDSGTLYGTKANSITSAQLLSSVSDETGTGLLVFSTSPTFTTQITSPLVIGGAAVDSILTLRSTSGAGTTDMIIFQVGNNGATEAMRIVNNRDIYIGNGRINGVPVSGLIQATGGFGTNVVGATLTLCGGKATGNAAGGNIVFQTSDAGASSTLLQTLTTKLILTETGKFGIGSLTPTKTFQIQKDFAVDDGIEMLDSGGGFFRVQQTTGIAGAFQPAFTGFATGDVSSLVFKGLRNITGTTYPTISFITRNSTDATGIPVTDTSFRFANHTIIGALMLGSGNWGFGGIVTPTAKIHIGAGTTTANTAPLQFTSGVSETVARAGVVEFTTDDLFFTITTGAARKGFIFNDGTNLISGRIPIVATNGRLTDDADFTFATDTLTVTKIAATTITGNMTFEDGKNIIFKTTTGTKIGTATNQKIGFWNATPIVQPTTAIAAATFVANTSGIANDTATFDGYTLGQAVKALRNFGFLA